VLTQNCKITHLNTAQWRRLSELVFGNRFPKRAFLFHEAGKPLRAWKHGAGDLPLPSGSVIDPQEAADKLAAEHPDAAEAWVLDPAVFAKGLSAIQAKASFDTQIDIFSLMEFDERQLIPGFAVSPRRDFIWRGLPLRRVQRFVEKMLPDSCTFVLGVFDGDALWASLLCQFENRQLVAISTSDALPADDVKDIIGRDQHPFFLSVVANAFRRPAFGWFVQRPQFEAWMKAPDEESKEEIFQKAIMENHATFDFSILVDRGITAFSPLNPGEAAVQGQDREANPRTRTPNPDDPGPSAV
jgi:hypothetical protein